MEQKLLMIVSGHARHQYCMPIAGVMAGLRNKKTMTKKKKKRKVEGEEEEEDQGKEKVRRFR